MTDQCKHCELRGDIGKCKETECSHHENWYALEQQKRIKALENALKPFAQFACSEYGECECNNCKAIDLLRI